MFLKLDWGIIWPIVNIVVFYLLLRKYTIFSYFNSKIQINK